MGNKKFGMTVDGKGLKNVIIMKGRSKPAFAPLNRNIKQMRVGARLLSTTTAPLQISQPFAYIGRDGETTKEIKRKLSDWLITDNEVPIVFGDEPEITYYGLVESGIEDFEKFSIARTGTIKILCLDPYGYGKEHQVNINGSSVVDNTEGQLDVDWVSEVKFTSSATVYTISSGGEEVKVKGNFNAGDVLKIDSKKRRIVVNNVPRVGMLDIKSRWFKLKSGNVTVVTSHQTKLSFRDTYY